MHRWPAAVLASLCLLLASPAHAFNPPIRPSAPLTESRLPNGMTVIIEEDRTLPIVSLRLRYSAGARNDPSGKAGLAVLTERMMVQASKHVGDGDYFRYLDRAGASRVDQGTGYDATWFHVTLPANRIALPLWLWSDQMGFFVERADQSLLNQQREMLRNERRERKENTPIGLVPEFIQAELYPFSHPYHNPIIGPPVELDSLSVADTQGFHQRWYSPDRASLVISGHVDRAETLALIEKYFGPILPASTPEPTVPIAPSLPSEVRIDVAARVERPIVSFAWDVPGWYASGDADIDVMVRLLAGTANALILWKVGDEMKIATRAVIDHYSRQYGSMLELRVTAAPGHDASEILPAVDEVLQRLRTEPIQIPSIERAKTERLLAPTLALERTSARVERYSVYRQLVGKADYLDADFQRFAAVTPTTIMSAAARWLGKGRIVTVVTPTPTAPVCGAVTRISRGPAR